MMNKHEPTQQTQDVLKSLQKAVKATLLKKQQLGQYSVVWDGEKPVQQQPHLSVTK